MNDRARTVVLLIRHGHTDAVGDRLSGRIEDLPLNQVGRAQAERLRARLATTDIAAVYSSPAATRHRDRGAARRRTKPAHRTLARTAGGRFGEWSGERFEALERDLRWSRFNNVHSLSSPPARKRPLETQARVVGALDVGGTRHPNQTVAFVTHADVIRLAIPTPPARRSTPSMLRHPAASVTAIDLNGEDSTVLYVNDRDARTPL
jgi:broad specificity phosphatase PhoE